MTLTTIHARGQSGPVAPPAEPGVGSEEAIASWRAWRATRAAELRRPHGWLSLAGFTWLAPDGSDLPGLPGRWAADGDAVTVTAGPVDALHLIRGTFADAGGVVVDPFTQQFGGPPDRPLSGAFRIPLPDGASVLAVRHGDRQVELLRRAGRPALRIRDPRAATRTGFRGIPTFDWAQAWVIAARFVPTPEPVAEVVLTARPDLLTTAVTHGRVDFSVAGTPASLAATIGADGGLAIAFRDRTNGVLTADWRVLTATAPDRDQTVLLDFNRAINPPFAFTAYGTCPAPVAANRLPVAVTAGEQAPLVPASAR